MAKKTTKAQSDAQWLSQRGKDGAIPFVDSGGSGEVAWQGEKSDKNSLGQTYAQGTIHKNDNGSYAIYDGAQNWRGVITGDGTVHDGEGRDISASTLGASALAAVKQAGEVLDGGSYEHYRAGVEAQRESARETYRSSRSGVSGGSGGRSTVREQDWRPLLEQWRETAAAQAKLGIDRATENGVAELERQRQEAQGQFRTQQEQIAAEEAYAKDNEALYARMRGDNGGVGQSRYTAVMNTAALRRQSVADAQVKLSADVGRQITQLRADGEFEKAEAVLSVAQDYLDQLLSMERWSAEHGLDAARFNESVRQWDSEFRQKLAEYGTGVRQSLSAAEQKRLDAAGEALLKAGLLPNASQLAAMGLTEAQARAMLDGTRAGNYGGGSVGDWKQELYDAGKMSNTQAVEHLMQRYGLSRLDAQAWVYGRDGDASYAQWASERKASSSGTSGGRVAMLK